MNDNPVSENHDDNLRDELRAALSKMEDEVDKIKERDSIRRDSGFFKAAIVTGLTAILLNTGLGVFHEISDSDHDSAPRTEYVLIDYDGSGVIRHEETEHIVEDELERLSNENKTLRAIIDSIKQNSSHSRFEWDQKK